MNISRGVTRAHLVLWAIWVLVVLVGIPAYIVDGGQRCFWIVSRDFVRACFDEVTYASVYKEMLRLWPIVLSALIALPVCVFCLSYGIAVVIRWKKRSHRGISLDRSSSGDGVRNRNAWLRSCSVEGEKQSEANREQNLHAQGYCPLCNTPFKNKSARPPYVSDTRVRIADMTLRDAGAVIKEAFERSIAYYIFGLLVLGLVYLGQTVTPSFTSMNWPISLPRWAQWWLSGTLAAFVFFSCGTLKDFGLYLVLVSETWVWGSTTQRILWVIIPPILGLLLYHAFLVTWLILVPCISTYLALDTWKQRRIKALEADLPEGSALD